MSRGSGARWLGVLMALEGGREGVRNRAIDDAFVDGRVPHGVAWVCGNGREEGSKRGVGLAVGESERDGHSSAILSHDTSKGR